MKLPERAAFFLYFFTSYPFTTAILLLFLKINFFNPLSVKSFYTVLLLSGLVFSVSCDKYKEYKNKIRTKKEISMSPDVQPEEDLLNAEVSDTATFYAHTIRHETSRSYQDQYKYLGSNQDPVFGRTDVGIFTNFSIANNVSNISFGSDAVVDSAEMILAFTRSFVGDTTTPMRYKVHQLTTAISKSTSYYMDDATVAYNSTTISDATTRTTFTNGFYTVKFPVDQSFASALITNTVYLVNNTALQAAYKGFYITTSSTALYPGGKEGALMKFDLDNAVSGLYVYYHNSSAASKSSKSYRFSFSGDNASRFNKVSYAYNSVPNNSLADILLNKDTTNTTNLFVKGLAGTKAVFRLPFLKNYVSQGNISVARAEIVFKVDQSFGVPSQYEPPLQLSLVAVDENSKETYVADQYYATELTRFGGGYDPVNKQYVFNISRHVQEILNDKIKNYGFYLVVANPDKIYVARRDDKAARVILGGIGSAYAPTFKLTYVRYAHDN
jgi:hypothetical protein